MEKQVSIKNRLEICGVQFDSLGKNKTGNYVIRKGFFYTSGYTSDKYAATLKQKFPQAVIVNHSEVWKVFRGGAGVAAQSHWYVEFKIDSSLKLELPTEEAI